MVRITPVTTHPTFQPLAGIRVLDITQVLAGPYASYQLALMGADVIKIERPGDGDWTRTGGADTDLAKALMGLPYLTQNANKKSVTLDLKQEQGRAVLQRMLPSCDVFLENLRPGAMSALGFSFEQVRKFRPNIVYCSISAFGQDGPLNKRRAYDHVVQGMSGIMHATGTRESGPTKVGAPYIDYATGLNGAFAILAALHEVRRTGNGIKLDVAMLDTALLLMASHVTAYLTAGTEPRPAGNEAFSGSAASGCFSTRDGLLMLAANTEEQWQSLCRVLNNDTLATEPRWKTSSDRSEHAADLRTILAEELATKTTNEWDIQLNEAGVPAGSVMRLAEILDHAQCQAREITQAVHLPETTSTPHLPTLGFKANGYSVAPSAAPPTLGRDTETILLELGFDKDEITALREGRVI
jgi:crotonobetainyl-CoA:carnitine CoA-transferase CaiB-like acyl-CoA transferase